MEVFRTPRHIFIGMSGGVDSSAAALLLQQAGYQVSGVHLRLLTGLALSPCTPQDAARDAEAVARRLDIPFYLLDLSADFRRCVVADFIAEYQLGRTPNPCVICNRTIKFGAMLAQIKALGGDAVATGHYAQVEQSAQTGRWLLKRGAARDRDQSYFLCGLTQEQLSCTVFPLGGLCKETVRRIAEDGGLVTARKRDSQDICFVPDGDYAGFIDRTVGYASPTGPFLDMNGRELGRHRGFIRYTLGQHRGLGLSIEPPLYVLEKDPATHAIRLGPDSALFSQTLEAERMNWISIPALTAPMAVTVKTRSRQKECAAVAEPLPGGRIRVVFEAPQRAVTPGQTVVLYDGDVVVGGGKICG